MLRAKICGITNEHDAAIAINLGAWAIGFNFYRNSPRYVSLEKAKKIVSSLPAEVVTVGILINYSEKEVVESLEVLDFIQVYENKPFLNSYKSKTIISFPCNKDRTWLLKERFQDYAYILLDAPYKRGLPIGGTGRCADWSFAKILAKKHKLILAGGLTHRNVIYASSQVRPFAVDVASGVETIAGVKCETKLSKFFKRCRDEK